MKGLEDFIISCLMFLGELSIFLLAVYFMWELLELIEDYKDRNGF